MGQQPLPGEYSIPIIRVDDPRHTLALMAARYYRAPAAHRRRGHRHQRQDLRQRLPAADLGEGGPQGGEPRHDRPGRAGRRGDRQPHHARSDQAARDHGRSRGRRRHASRPRGVEPRPRAAPARWRPPRGRRLHQPHARPPRLPSDARILSSGEAQAVRYAAAEGRGRRDRRRSAGGGEGAEDRQGARARIFQRRPRRRDAEARLRHPHARRLAAARRSFWREALREPAARRPVPDLQRAGRRRAR